MYWSQQGTFTKIFSIGETLVKLIATALKWSAVAVSVDLVKFGETFRNFFDLVSLFFKPIGDFGTFFTFYHNLSYCNLIYFL